MSTLPLDTRQARIARLLLEQTGPSNVEDLAATLGLTGRVVRYNLPSVGAFFRARRLRLVLKRGVGVWVEGDPSARVAMQATLREDQGPSVLVSADRRARIIVDLLDAAPEALRLETLETGLGVSRPTARRDVRAAESWLDNHRVHLRRLPGVGIAVRGSEIDVRGALVAIVVESIGPHVLAGLVTGSTDPARVLAGSPVLGPYVTQLDLRATWSVLQDEVQGIDESDPGMLTAAVYLAVVARRIRAGRGARLARGRMRSLMDHPASATAARIAGGLARGSGLSLPTPEVAAITESLLGFVELADARGSLGPAELRLIDGIIAASAARLHPSLAEDALLRASLTDHVRRLNIRLRYGLPVTNPLHGEVRDRYPDVYRVAADVLNEVGPVSSSAIPPEEVGFLTMYLAGSLERQRLRPKVRVMVVCPAGMATAWILVSRLLAEFPHVEIARVVSKTAFESELDDVAADVVVSTVPLEHAASDWTSVVVSPLLRDRDIRRLSRVLGAPAH